MIHIPEMFYLSSLRLMVIGVSFAYMTLAAFPVLASSPTSNVGTSKVEAGAASVEYRMGYSINPQNSSDHQRFRMREHLDYGWNGWYATRFVVEQDKRRGDNIEHAIVSIENRFQLFEKAIDGWDGGFRINYGQRDGDKTPHEIDLRLMAQVPFNKGWEWRHNTVFEHDIGPDAQSGWFIELRNQVTAPLPYTLGGIATTRAGLEMFNDFGRINEINSFNTLDHQLGPVAKVDFDNGYYLQTGYRAGLTRSSANHIFKLYVGKDF
jgi:hypothetical protein